MCSAACESPCRHPCVPRAPLQPPAIAVPPSSPAPEPMGWECGDVPSETQPGLETEDEDGLKHSNWCLPVSLQGCACRGVLSSCTHRAPPPKTARARVLMSDGCFLAGLWGPALLSQAHRHTGNSASHQASLGSATAALHHHASKVGGQKLRAQRIWGTNCLGDERHLNSIRLLGLPPNPSELWLLEAIGWLFYNSQIWGREGPADGLWLKAWERGRGAGVGNGLMGRR